MGPQVHSNLPRSQPLNFQSCNSTANLFLGRAKRNWMTQSSPSTLQDLPSNTLQSFAPTPNPNSPQNVPSLPQIPASSASNEPASPALISPITPGETPPKPDTTVTSLPSTTCSIPATTSGPSQSLPSPAPSAHNPSPPALSDANPTVNPPHVASMSTTTTTTTTTTRHGIVNRDSTASNNNNGGGSAGTPRVEGRIDENFWSDALKQVDILQFQDQRTRLSEGVDVPRICLLRTACVEKDLLYLALHQVYCLQSCFPRQLAAMFGLSQSQINGLEVIKELLVDNQQASRHFLNWASNFPNQLPVMLGYSQYAYALRQLSQLLVHLAERWGFMEQQVRSRRYPPLIDELVNEFCITSSVLLEIIFLAMCRRIHGRQLEAQLRELFLQNKQNYLRRFAPDLPPLTEETMRAQNQQLIDQYLTFLTPLPPMGVFHNRNPSMGLNQASPSQGYREVIGDRSPRVYRAMQTAGQYRPAVNAYVPSTTPTQAPYMRSQVVERRHQNVQGSFQILPPQTQNMYASHPSGTQAKRPVAMPSQVPRQPVESVQTPHPNRQNFINVEPGLRRQNQQTARARPSQQQQRRHMFLPPEGAPPPNTSRPNPLRLALHQAQLRDPIKKLVRQSSEGQELVQLFQCLNSFAVPPSLLGQRECSFEWKFPVSNIDRDKSPRLIQTTMGNRALRIFAEGCRAYHLRCIKVSPSTKEEDLGLRTWNVADTVWPSVIYVFVNGVEHYVRRKVHNGRDLPLDITDALCEGENKISFHFLRNPAETKDVLYALAVEVMDIASVDQLKQLVQFLPASETHTRVQQHLSSSGADDDLSIVNDDISVDLICPFTCRIFNTPARGVDCSHLECFDLDTYFITKASKSGKGPMEWNWRCPICDKDARPQSLIVDNYLVHVRAELERNNQLADAKAIRIKADGSWELKTEQEPQTGEDMSGIVQKRKRDSSSSPPAQKLKVDTSSPCPTRPVSEVIELD